MNRNDINYEKLINDYNVMVKALAKPDERDQMLNHAVMGIAGESGEVVDVIKKHTIYGKPLNLSNVIEELGDEFFYMVFLMQTLNISFKDVLQANMDKLGKRYSSGAYTNEQAIKRADKK